MADFKGFWIWVLAWGVRIILFLPALALGIYYSAKEKKLGDYFYSLGIGIDIYGHKLIAPYANKHFIKPGGRRYGGDETISKNMAINKLNQYNTLKADAWERRINFVDRDHLNKTLKNYNLN